MRIRRGAKHRGTRGNSGRPHRLPRTGDILLRFHLAALAGLVSCFALGASASAQEVNLFKVLKLEGHQVRWQAPAHEAPRVVTYRVVAEAAEYPGARNCRKLAPLDALIQSSQLSHGAVTEEIGAAFAMWEAAANIAFREAPEGTPADILIGAQVEPEGWAFADVFYDAASPEAIKAISRALICLNPLRRWKVGFDGDLKVYDLRYTLAHEIGHAIGLDHPSGGNQIMGYRYDEQFRSLQPGDLRGAVLLYGAPRTPAVAAAASAPLQGSAAQASPPRLFARRWGSRGLTTRPTGP